MKKGFTLPEILTVLAIITIIALIAIPSVVLIRKRINERLFNSKKEMIILAAELYGQDNKDSLDQYSEINITVGELVQKNYLEKDTDADGEVCLSDYGCIIDPRDNTNLNEILILIKKIDKNIKAVWEGTAGSTTNKDLVELVKTQLDCTPTESVPCLYTGEVNDNYLSYSGIMWRIVGVYLIDGEQIVKLITDENIK